MPLTLVAVRAFLIGGTVPVLLRAVSPTAGAIAGVLAAPFLLIPSLGVRGAACAAAALNVAAAAIAFARDPGHVDGRGPVDVASTGRSLALTLYGIAGGIALGYEVIWSHVVVQFVSTRAFAFSIMLATYLTGLVIGSAIYARLADRVRRRWLAFGVLIALAGLLSLVLVSVAGPWLMALQSDLEDAVRGWTGNETAAMCAWFATWIGGRDQLDRFAAGAPAVTDDRPAIEYAAWVRPLEIVRVLPTLLESSTLPPLPAPTRRFSRASFVCGGKPELESRKPELKFRPTYGLKFRPPYWAAGERVADPGR